MFVFSMHCLMHRCRCQGYGKVVVTRVVSPGVSVQGMSLETFVSDDSLTATQLCTSEVHCTPNSGLAGSTTPATGKLSFDLSVAGSCGGDDAAATAKVLEGCKHEALQQPRVARSLQLFVRLRVRARRRCTDMAFRQHWLRMRMKALAVLTNTDRKAAHSALLAFSVRRSWQICRNTTRVAVSYCAKACPANAFTTAKLQFCTAGDVVQKCWTCSCAARAA